jgi:hypothetical protein
MPTKLEDLNSRQPQYLAKLRSDSAHNGSRCGGEILQNPTRPPLPNNLPRNAGVDKDLKSHHGKSGGSVCILPGVPCVRSGEADDGQHRMSARA